MPPEVFYKGERKDIRVLVPRLVGAVHDLDSVIIDLPSSAIERFNEGLRMTYPDSGIQMRVDDITKRSVRTTVPCRTIDGHEFMVTHDLGRYFINDDVVRTSDLVPGARDLLETLSARKVGENELDFFQLFHTSRPPGQEQMTREQLKAFFPNLYQDFKLSMNKRGLKGGEFKGENALGVAETVVASRLYPPDATVLVTEDDPEHALITARLAQKRNANIAVACIPYAQIDDERLYDPSLQNLFVVRRGQNQSLEPLVELLRE